MITETATGAEQFIADHMDNPYAGDDKLYVMFFYHPVESPEDTAREGRPIFHDREFIQIMVPGNKDLIVVREVRDTDKQRFPKQYAAWKNRQNQDAAVGTPLAAWPAVTRSQVAELEYFGCKTVEQLAAMPDNQAQKFMGIQILRKKAQDFLAYSKDVAPLSQMQKELTQRDNEIATLRAAVEEQSKLLEELKKQRR